jgi:hypothetical protein
MPESRTYRKYWIPAFAGMTGKSIFRLFARPLSLRKGERMKISIEKNLVEFEPESDSETDMIEGLWKLMVDCAKFNKKLVPVGEYIPQKRNLARFAIEG